MLEQERQNPSYQMKQESGRRRRAEEQATYAENFRESVRQFLQFHPRFAAEEAKLADLISAHAVPVGSGTVARTERRPIQRSSNLSPVLSGQCVGHIASWCATSPRAGGNRVREWPKHQLLFPQKIETGPGQLDQRVSSGLI